MANIVPLTEDKLAETLSFLASQNMHVTNAQLSYLLQQNTGLSQLALKEGKVVGCVLCSYDGMTGYLQRLVVDQQERGGGLGKQMVAAAIDALRLKACDRVIINCHPYMAKWYESQGFTKTELVNYQKDLAAQDLAACV